ncbi:MAG: hypothetical protein KDB88_07390, partial [Flavobacteriales bacterium]|nr:hypothetical protein [Flavobacteriales bacterium]
ADDTDALFEYHIATDALLGEKMITTHQDVSAGNTYTFMVHVDMANIASSIDFKNNLDTHTGNNMPLAVRVRDLLLSSMILH